MPETSALDSDAFELAPDTILSPGTAGGALGPQGDVAYRTTPSVPTASRACPGIFLQVHTDLAAIEGEWRALEAKADLTAFQCFDWAAKWQKHIGARNDTQPAIILGRDAEGEPLFVLPLAIERRWLARRLTSSARSFATTTAPCSPNCFCSTFALPTSSPSGTKFC